MAKFAGTTTDKLEQMDAYHRNRYYAAYQVEARVSQRRADDDEWARTMNARYGNG